MAAGTRVRQCADFCGQPVQRRQSGRASSRATRPGTPDRHTIFAIERRIQNTGTRGACRSCAMNLAWHIFRKDWRILWPLAVATMLLQVLVMMVIRHSTPFPMTDGTSAVAALLTFALVISMTLLIVLTVQQEAIPSIHQDWLTRPVARGDLLLAKLLALLLLVHGPIVTVNVLQGLAEGFPLGSVLHATLNSNF